ncbi:hypothetical protein AAC387_Pa02g0792 [Persea americana]
MLSARPSRSPRFSEGGEDDDYDESKTRKTNLCSFPVLPLPNNNNITKSLFLPLTILTIVIVLIIIIVMFRNNLVCITQSDHLNLLRMDGSNSDFGSLGVPWCRSKLGQTVEWTTKDLIKGLEEFIPIYETRPIKNNVFGMGFDHSFGLWFIARWLKPDLMIESGAFKGHSTWVLRQAMPEMQIISLSPRHPKKYLKKGAAYVDENCTYFAGKDFIDFGSVDWKSVMKKHGILDLSRVLVFFDDHQNELKRLKQALKAGFQHLVFEDNYDSGTGDHYSLRQICDQSYIRGGGHSCFRDSDEARARMERKKFWEKAVDIEELCGEGDSWWGVRGEMRDDFNHSNKEISHAEHFQNSRFVESVLDMVYLKISPTAP